MSAPLATKAKAKKRTMPRVPGSLAEVPKRSEPPKLASEPEAPRGVLRGTQSEAFAAIVDPWKKRGWGFRCSLVGASGSGKTFFTKGLIAYCLRTGAASTVLVYDHKDPDANFDGVQCRDVAGFVAREPQENDPSTVVFHEEGPGDPDSVAALGMFLAGEGEATLTVIDELFPDAVSEGGQQFKEGATCEQAVLLRTGRSRKASAVFGTQMPQEMPTAVMDLSEANVVFRLQARGLNYMRRDERIPPEAVSVVKNLREGECILISEGAWDGRIYGPAV